MAQNQNPAQGNAAAAAPPPRKQPQQKQPQPKKPAGGAPAAGAGGQKAAGTAVPPKQKAGTQPAAGKPVQPLTQKPGQAPRPLNQAQKNQVQKAAQGGTLDQYLANHPGVAKHYGKVQAGGTSGQQAKYATLQQQNTAAKGGQPGQPPSTGAPAAGAGGGKPNAPAAQPTPAPTPPTTPDASGGGAAPGAAPAAPQQDTGADVSVANPAAGTFGEAFNAQYGTGANRQFGPSEWTGQNPIETARAAAQRALDENLANTRARYAGSGFGNSAREALTEGQAVGDFATQFGDVASQRAEQERQTGLDRLANMFGTAGAQQLQGKQIGLEANQQLANLGTGITGIGAQEQGLPNQSDFITLLTNMGITNTFSQGAMRPPKQ